MSKLMTTFIWGQVNHFTIIYSLRYCFFFVHCVNPIIYPCLPLFLDRLSLLLAKERSHTQTYLGCMKKGPVFTDPKLKWLASHFCLYLPILRIYILHLALPFPISFLPPRRSRSMIPAPGSGVIQTESIWPNKRSLMKRDLLFKIAILYKPNLYLKHYSVIMKAKVNEMYWKTLCYLI